MGRGAAEAGGEGVAHGMEGAPGRSEPLRFSAPDPEYDAPSPPAAGQPTSFFRSLLGRLASADDPHRLGDAVGALDDLEVVWADGAGHGERTGLGGPFHESEIPEEYRR